MDEATTTRNTERRRASDDPAAAQSVRLRLALATLLLAVVWILECLKLLQFRAW